VTADGPAGGTGDVRYTRDAGPASVGRRVVLRRRLPEGGLGDVVGTVEHWAGGTVRVRDRSGALHQVDEASVVAAKHVPPAPERRR
jgi:hypothetical protein